MFLPYDCSRVCYLEIVNDSNEFNQQKALTLQGNGLILQHGGEESWDAQTLLEGSDTDTNPCV